MQLPLWKPESEWRPTPISELPSWAGAKRIGLDVETCDPTLKQLGIGTRRGGFIAGVSFAIEDGPSFYLPARHEQGDNLDPGQVFGYLSDQMKAFDGDYVGANLSYDYDYLLEEGMKFHPEAKFRDIQIADPLINELHDSYSLDNIAKRYGLPGKDEELLRQAAQAYGVDPKGSMWRLPARFVGAYAMADVVQPLLTLRRQERHISDLNLQQIWDLETDVLPVLVHMRRRGVPVNEDRLREVEEWSLTQEAEALRLVKDQTGCQIKVGDVWKADALAPALQYIGVKLTETSTGKPSIDKDVLGDIDHSVAKALAWARKVNKLRTTFAASVRTYMINGKIHCTFNQIARQTEKGDQRGARFGRLSATDPNMQQQPSRDEFAEMWRSIYGSPHKDELWSSNDYSQQEPRWTTHFAAEMNLEGAREAAKAYHDDPDLDNHQFMADLTGLPRKQAKNIYLGLCYGEGGAKLCRELGLPTRWAVSIGDRGNRQIMYAETREEILEIKRVRSGGFVWEAAGEEGQRILDTFDERAPFIRKLSKAASKRASQRGYITTGGGRRLNFPQRQDGSYDWTHKSLNRLIQGTSADQMKKAVVEIDRAGYWLMLQVHDETDSLVGSHKEADEIGAIMRDIVPARVPFKVDTEVGPSWGEAR